MPADTSVYLIFILNGGGVYNGVSMKAGDVIALGLNKDPMIGLSHYTELFMVDMEFHLFFQLTGMEPAFCQQVIPLNEDSFLKDVCGRLMSIPSPQRPEIVEQAFLSRLRQGKYLVKRKLERIVCASKLLEVVPLSRYESIARQMNISLRQLERDFTTMLGITLQDYSRIRRFHRSIRLLRRMSAAEAAYLSGYSDQAHMTKEFKKMSIWTPAQALQSFDLNFEGIPLGERSSGAL
ncbi:helix-turn-helix domain-containing protein [Gorillibacterium sp. CAU 1737]|uniref:helix-turn-helix domain-containing protein n=1 Tax=Gorillibacterium sp. CAU 1737 TaxID=3140362 RepID=UPI0032612A1B